ncbi:MAG: hypothetical protein ACKVOE_08060 [Rickettsiales bacterium]
MATTTTPNSELPDTEADAAADTHITVNNNPRNIPAPNFTAGTANTTSHRYGEETLNEVADEASVTPTAGGSHINWGQVIKGVAIVTAAVVAVAVVYTWAPVLIANGLTALNTSPVFGPIIGALHSGAIWGIHALSEAATIAGSFFSTLWAAVAPAAGSATTAALVPAQITAAGNALGVVATGGAVAASVAVAAPAIGHLHLVDHNTLTSAAMPPHDGGASASLAGGATPDSSFADMLSYKKAALADALHQSSASNIETAHHSVDLAHRNTHEHLGAESPDAPGPHAAQNERRTRANLLRAQKAQENWVERVGDTGAAASKSTAITPRDASFSKQVDLDAAKLNEALAAPSV